MSKDFDLEFEKLLKESARVAAEFDASEEDHNLDQSQELSERHALRRVQGFSTELQDISEAEYRQLVAHVTTTLNQRPSVQQA